MERPGPSRGSRRAAVAGVLVALALGGFLLARRILTKVEAKRQAFERRGFGVSIGIDIAPLSEAAFESMYRRADQALYKAKGAGRNRYVISDVGQALA